MLMFKAKDPSLKQDFCNTTLCIKINFSKLIFYITGHIPKNWWNLARWFQALYFRSYRILQRLQQIIVVICPSFFSSIIMKNCSIYENNCCLHYWASKYISFGYFCSVNISCWKSSFFLVTSLLPIRSVSIFFFSSLRVICLYAAITKAQPLSSSATSISSSKCC